jgi:methionyl-tRNA synthetase
MLADRPDQPPVVVTATAPTPNGPLHVGHLSGPYVAADIAARAARARGERVLTFSGLDPHQNYVPAKAALERRPAEAVLQEYSGLVRRALRAARVGYDVFADPHADAAYRESVRYLVGELVARKAAIVEPALLARCGGCGRTLHHAYVSGGCPVCGATSGGGTCEGCGSFTTAGNLVDARCGCGGTPVPFEADVPLLRLESYRGALTEIWASAELPGRVRAMIGRYLAAGLPDVPLAYPTDWGIQAASGERVDVWVEMGLGFLARMAVQVHPAARTLDDFVLAWRRLGACWNFLGIDNAFYFGILFPGLFTAAGVPVGWLGGLIVNEFYRLDGLKFSTSRNHAIWAHEFLAGEDPGVLRLFLCWDRPDRVESDFTRHAYEKFRDWIGPALHAGGGLPDELAAAEVRRAEQALHFGGFDPGLALRCLLAAGAARAPSLLKAMTGGDEP